MKRFSAAEAESIGKIKYFRIRAGDSHRFIGIWVVVVKGRVFVRPWNDRVDGWYRVMVADSQGAVQVGDEVVLIRAACVESAALLDAVDEAYAAKYTTKPNQPYVSGFATANRRGKTLELLPR